MALREPAWRVKSRPCPFYQQGRCLFADSCNFLHSVSVRAVSDAHEPSRPGYSAIRAPSTHNTPPTVTVQSPLSVRSPPRSPRLSGLLLALKDVIGEDPDDLIIEEDAPEDNNHQEESVTLVSPLDASEESLMAILGPPHPKDIVEGAGSLLPSTPDFVTNSNDDTSCTHPTSPQENDTDTTVGNLADVTDVDHTITDAVMSGLLSPVELSDLQLKTFALDGYHIPKHEDSIDSGYADTWNSPRPLVRSPPQRGSARSSIIELLSSPFGSHSSRVLSPHLSEYIARGPFASTFSSPRQSWVVGDDAPAAPDTSLDSPESRVDQVLEPEYEEESVFEGSFVVEDPDIDGGTESSSDSEGEVEVDGSPGAYSQHYDDFLDTYDEEDPDEGEDPHGSTSVWDAESQPTVVYTGMPSLSQGEVSAALRRDSKSPRHFLQESVAFVGDEAVEESSFVNAAEDLVMAEQQDEFSARTSGDYDHDYHLDAEADPSAAWVNGGEQSVRNSVAAESALIEDDSNLTSRISSGLQHHRDIPTEVERNNLVESPQSSVSPEPAAIAVDDNRSSLQSFAGLEYTRDTEPDPISPQSIADRTSSWISMVTESAAPGSPVRRSRASEPFQETDATPHGPHNVEYPLDNLIASPNAVEYVQNIRASPIVPWTSIDGKSSRDSISSESGGVGKQGDSPFVHTKDNGVAAESLLPGKRDDGPSPDISHSPEHFTKVEADNAVSKSDAHAQSSRDSLAAESISSGKENVALSGTSDGLGDVRHSSPKSNTSFSGANENSAPNSTTEEITFAERGGQSSLRNSGSFELPEYILTESSSPRNYSDRKSVRNSVTARPAHTVLQDSVLSPRMSDGLITEEQVGVWYEHNSDGLEQYGDSEVKSNDSRGSVDEVFPQVITPGGKQENEFSPRSHVVFEHYEDHEADTTTWWHNTANDISSTGDLQDHFLQDVDDYNPPQNSVAAGYMAEAIVDEPAVQVFDVTEGYLDVEDEDTSPFSASPTAQPSNLANPTAVQNGDDTLTSLYDVYSDIASTDEDELSTNQAITNTTTNIEVPPPAEAAPSPITSLSESSRSSPFLRERVFTPPPASLTRSTSITSNSTDSRIPLPSPPTSVGSSSRGHTSPFTIKAHPTLDRRSLSPDAQDVDVSTKVPFGFRHSFALGRTSGSSLISDRESRHRPRAFSRPQPISSIEEKLLSPDSSSPTPIAGPLKPLRLSTVLSTKPHTSSSLSSRNSTFSINSYRQSGNINRVSISSTSVLSDKSILNNPLTSSSRPSVIPEHIQNTPIASHDQVSSTLSPLSSDRLRHLTTYDQPQSAPAGSQPASWHTAPKTINNIPKAHTPSRLSNRFSEPVFVTDADEGDRQDEDNYESTIRRPLPVLPHTAPVTRPVSVIRPPMYAIATPKPTLMFAIASDDVSQVRQALESGDVGPNDAVGPQSALAFALTNDQLTNKMDIVKALLAYGADPSVLKKAEQSPRKSEESEDVVEGSCQPPQRSSMMDGLDPATRYYVERADAAHTRRTSALIHRSFFRPLTRVRYELVGQDRALEQLFRVLSIHSRQLSVTPIVVLLCGPSGHGKSLLARKFGSLLDVPTHTVNMTTLKSTHDLWQSYSMSPYEAPTSCTLAEFLINNEGKRCVVVLDEIEKTEDEKFLWSLLMPWELGRCTFDNGRPIDVRNVIWLGTSNVGHDLVFEHHASRELPDELMTREEYVELMGLLRPRVSERLGASVLSRVTTVLPFVPFTPDEKRAITSEALHTLAGEEIRSLAPRVVESMMTGALAGYSHTEGARSIYRAVSNQLIDNL